MELHRSFTFRADDTLTRAIRTAAVRGGSISQVIRDAVASHLNGDMSAPQKADNDGARTSQEKH